MPDPAVPGSLPVAFDHARADEAVRALEVLAHALGAAAPRWHEVAQTARRDWHGFSRRWFDTEHGALLHDVSALVAVLRRTAAAIDLARADAARLQARRDDEAAAANAADLRRLADLAPSPVPAPGTP